MDDAGEVHVLTAVDMRLLSPVRKVRPVALREKLGMHSRGHQIAPGPVQRVPVAPAASAHQPLHRNAGSPHQITRHPPGRCRLRRIPPVDNFSANAYLLDA